MSQLKCHLQDFPGCPVVKNLDTSAGDMGSVRGPGISHVPRGNWACAPQLLKLMLCSLCSQQEKPLQRSPYTATREEPSLTATRESPQLAKENQHNYKYINREINKTEVPSSPWSLPNLPCSLCIRLLSSHSPLPSLPQTLDIFV